MRLPYNTLSSEGMKTLGNVYAYITRCGLEKPLVHLAFLRTSQINGCAYCINMHTHEAVADGASLEKLMLVAVWRDAGNLFTKREQAALAWAEVVTQVSDTHVPLEAFTGVREVFEEKELSDLTIAIGLMNVYNRLSISFRQTPDIALKQPAGE